jgi:hypothetical protein
MKNKQIVIGLEQIRATAEIQHHEAGCATPRTELIEKPTRYQIIKLRNVAVLGWGLDRKLRIGDSLTEAEADELSRCPNFEVTITI